MKITVLGMIGDVLVDRDNPEIVFSEAQKCFDDTDILFGNFEGCYSDNPELSVTSGAPAMPKLSNMKAIFDAKFDVMSFANNHIGDMGTGTMLDNKKRLNDAGIQVVGAGKNLAEARQAVIIEKNGIKFAYLAYASIFPYGYEARSNFPGLNPLRAENVYKDQIENTHCPGLKPRIETFPHKEDFKHLKEDINKAKEAADIVITCFHWGEMLEPFSLTDFEKDMSKAAIDEGADIVVAHHHHQLRGIEWYNSKPIFYGIGHFGFDIAVNMPKEILAAIGGSKDDPNFYGFQYREDWPTLPMNPNNRLTALAYVLVTESAEIEGIGFMPAHFRSSGLISPVDPESEEGKKVIDFVQKGIDFENLNGAITREGAITLGGQNTVRVYPKEFKKK